MKLTEEQIREAEEAFYSKNNPITPADSTNWREGVKWAMSQDQWLAVSERLPEVEDFYLVVVDNIVLRSKFYIDEDGDYGFARLNVTHWQPLPEPPNASNT